MYSPAKYGILTEYLPHQKLVLSNGWMEGLTVAAIILGLHPRRHHGRNPFAITTFSRAVDLPFIEPGSTRRPSWRSSTSCSSISSRRLINLYIPKVAIDHKLQKRIRVFIMQDFCTASASVARSARQVSAGGDHAVLGRGSDPAPNRAHLGRRWH